MIYFKLALRNVKKCFSDYTIYFLTLMFGVCIFYVFNSIDAQQSLMAINDSGLEGVQTLQMMMNYLSVFVSVILGLLIVYANRFLVRRRKKELAVYQVLGMDKGQISRVLTIETLLVALVSLACGLALGILLSQGFAVLTASLFKVKLAGFSFVFSPAAALKALVYFGIAFFLVIIFNRITIGRQKLITLLYADRKNELHKTPHLVLSVVLFIASLGILGTAYCLVETNGIFILNELFLTAFVLGIVGTVLFFYSLSGFFLKVIQQSKKIYLRGLNMFTLKQINSKINTAFVSVSMVCVMLFLSICALSFGLGFASSIQNDLERLNPCDASIDASLYEEVFDPLTDSVLETNGVSISVLDALSRTEPAIHSYARDIAEASVRDVEAGELSRGRYMHGDYITLSDYNRLLQIQGAAPVTLAENEFILNSVDESIIREYQEYFAENTTAILGTELTLKTVDERALYNVYSASDYENIHVLPDNLLANTVGHKNIVVVNFLEQTDECRDLLGTALATLGSDLASAYQAPETRLISGFYVVDKKTVLEENTSNAVIFTYLAVYLGIIFTVISAVVLAIAQLSEASDNRRRYDLLHKLGAEEKMVQGALFWQIALYFGTPLLLALFHSIFGLRFVNAAIVTVGKASVLQDSLTIAAMIIVVYGGYFLATYFGSRRILAGS